MTDISEQSKIKLPLSAWIAFTGAVLSFGVVWANQQSRLSAVETEVTAVRETCEKTTVQLRAEFKDRQEGLQKSLLDLQIEQRLQRELLIRIDERMKRSESASASAGRSRD